MTLKNYKPIVCPKCNRVRYALVKCDEGDCNFESYRDAIIDHFPSGPPAKYYCTLTGGVNAGKTFYLVSLIDALIHDKSTRNHLRRYGIERVFMVDPISKRNYRNLMNQCRMGKLALTLPTSELGFFSLFITTTSGSTVELVLFNTSGEKIEDVFLDGDHRTNAFELKGAAALHFVDPREDTRINNIIENPKDASYGPCKDYNIVDFLHRVLQVVNRGVSRVNNPVAVCISKFDLLFSLIPYRIPEYPFTELTSSNLFDEIASNSKSLSNFLEDHSTTIQPSELEEIFNALEYFAVAQYGKDTVPAFWEQRQPKGVIAPFLWILKELHILPNQNGYGR